jgi:hypothetical protein
MTIVRLWYLVLDSVKPRMQEIGGARKAKRMIIDGIWYLSLFEGCKNSALQGKPH